MYPIYVPTRSRVERTPTLKALANEEVADVTLVTPGEEREAYRARWDGWRFVAQPGKGIADARQAALDDARKRGVEWFWMLDDDTTGVYVRRSGTRLEREEFRLVMSLMEQAVEDSPNPSAIAMYGPNFRHRAWAGPPYEIDVHLRNFIAMRTDLDYRYWPYVKEDLDMVLQVINGGHHTLRFNAFAFDSPRMGTTEGGCWDDYLTGALDVASQMLPARWPGVVSMELDQATGMVTNRVNWRAVRARNIKDIPKPA